MASAKETNGCVDYATKSDAPNNNAASRVLRKLQLAMESGNFYEAHQTYRSLYFRYMTQKKYEELVQLLFDGATKLLDYGQTASGCDLALLLTDVLQRASYPVEEKILNRIESIFERLTGLGLSQSGRKQDDAEEKVNSASSDTSSSRDNFVANLISWSKVVAPQFKHGHPSLHGRLATTWWRMKNYEQSRYHFLLSDDGEGCASFLVEYHLNKGYPTEVDLFVTQAVLQFLCRKEKTVANTVLFKYAQYHPRIGACVSGSTATISKNSTQLSSEEPPYLLPLLNFDWLLLLCIDTGRVTDYSILIEKYQPSIKRDPCYTDYLDRIGQLYFGVPPPNRKTPASGIGGAFWRNLMSGFLGDDSDNVEEGPSSSADDTFESLPGTPTGNEAESSNGVQRPSTAKIAADETLD